MPRSVNRVTLIGNTGDVPNIAHTDSGQTIARVSLATSHRRKDRDGNQIERTEWHRVVFFGKLAEIVKQHVGKGEPLYIEGEIRYSKYTDKEGIERYGTDIAANEMRMLGSKRSDSRESDDQGYYERPQQRSQQRSNAGGTYRNNGGRQAANRQPQYDPASDGDIPF